MEPLKMTSEAEDSTTSLLCYKGMSLSDSK